VNGHTPETIQEFGTWSGYQTFHDPIRDQTSMKTDMFSCDDYELMFGNVQDLQKHVVKWSLKNQRKPTFERKLSTENEYRDQI
jgi:hypothetical protein